MEFEGSSSLHSLGYSFAFLFFSFTALFSVFSFLVFITRLKSCCNCEICQSYLTASWRSEFDNLSDWYTHLLRSSPTGTIHIHVLGNIITANPENVEHILKTKFDNYPKGKQFSVILGDLLGRGIFAVDGDSWKFQRKMASLELGSVSIRHFAFNIVTSEIRYRLIPLLSAFAKKENQVIDLQNVFRRFSFDTISKFSFGVDPRCLELSLPESELAAAFDLASKLSAERGMSPWPIIWKIKRLFNIGSEKNLKEAIKVVNSVAEELIKKRRQKGFSDHGDLLSRFMCSVNDDSYLRDIVVSFLLAGRDTVASALTFFFYALSQNNKVESDIRDELDRVMDASQELATLEQMRNMHYLHAALHETMRLYPPVQFDSKFSRQNDVLPDGTFVRGGTRVTYHTYAMGRMENIWGSDCCEFKPERWIRDGVFSPESAYKYPVFQAGARVCLGKEMAIVEMKSVAIAVVRRFDIRVVNGSRSPEFAPGLTASVRGGMQVFVKDREISSR